MAYTIRVLSDCHPMHPGKPVALLDGCFCDSFHATIADAEKTAEDRRAEARRRVERAEEELDAAQDDLDDILPPCEIVTDPVPLAAILR